MVGHQQLRGLFGHQSSISVSNLWKDNDYNYLQYPLGDRDDNHVNNNCSDSDASSDSGDGDMMLFLKRRGKAKDEDLLLLADKFRTVVNEEEPVVVLETQKHNPPNFTHRILPTEIWTRIGGKSWLVSVFAQPSRQRYP